ncbi:LysR substrate-binding domain-containing protein [Myxococcus sp. Y35]|uniref:LysR family transcriptional regulator n=1 Tax=Pseudomyxococcus flavus TaxID=3115648 RepID=UPI003CF1F8EC
MVRSSSLELALKLARRGSGDNRDETHQNVAYGAAMPLLDTDRLGGMRAFVSVATRHSFVAAADELGLSASALSRRIAQLERALGCRLLQRTTRCVALTEVGALYLERCLDVLARADEADAAVSAFSSQPRGLLRVALPNLYGQLRVAPLLPEFMRRYPLLRLEVTMEDRYTDLVEQRIDVGVRIGDLRSGDYVARRLALNRRRLCASPDYLQRKGTPRTPADLRGHACLQFAPQMKEVPWVLLRGGRRTQVPVEPWLRVDNAEALRQAALGGCGITLLADFVMGADLEAGRLVEVLPAWRAADSWVWAVYPHARFLPMKTRVFVDFLSERLGDVTSPSSSPPRPRTSRRRAAATR